MVELVVFVLMIAIAYFTGRAAEENHYRSIKKREKRVRHIPTVSFRTVPSKARIQKTRLASGSVVVSVDYFKRFLASLRQIFGGEVRSYSSLIDRARREAILRMKEAVPEADLFINTRIETSSISQGQSSIGSVEVLAYGTAIIFEK